jgi:hypothetical protein
MKGPLVARAFRRTQGVSGYSLFQPTAACMSIRSRNLFARDFVLMRARPVLFVMACCGDADDTVTMGRSCCIKVFKGVFDLWTASTVLSSLLAASCQAAWQVCIESAAGLY